MPFKQKSVELSHVGKPYFINVIISNKVKLSRFLQKSIQMGSKNYTETVAVAESSDDSESDVIESDDCEIDRGGYRFKFEEGFTAEKILAMASRNGELMFLFKYINSDEGEYVPSKIANVKFPQLVIRYYESIILWADQTEHYETD